jgi:hypothetical protein
MRTDGRIFLFILLLIINLPITSCAVSPDRVHSSDRSAWITRLESAIASTPPDLDILTKGLLVSDWLVATVAAEKLGQLATMGPLPASDQALVIQSLQKALSRKGRWWLLRWDEENPYFGAFQSAAIHSLSRFGVEALPTVRAMLESDSKRQQASACWVLVEMLSDEIVTTTQIHSNIDTDLSGLIQKDSGGDVEFSCQHLQKMIESSSAP